MVRLPFYSIRLSSVDYHRFILHSIQDACHLPRFLFYSFQFCLIEKSVRLLMFFMCKREDLTTETNQVNQLFLFLSVWDL